MRLLRLAVLVSMVVTVLGTSSCTMRSDRDTDTPAGATEDDTRAADASSAEGLVFARGGRVWVIDDGDAVPVTPPSGSHRSPAYDSDRSAILSIDAEGRVWRTPVSADGAGEALWESPYDSMLDNVRYDTGRDILWFAVIGDAATEVRTLRDGAESLEATESLSGEFDVRLSEEVIFATSAAQRPSFLWSIRGGQRDEIVSAPALYRPALSHDGRTLAVLVLNDENVDGIWVIDTDSNSVVDLPIGDARPTAVAVAPDGSTVAFRSARTGTIWTVALDDDVALDTGIIADEDVLAW